LFFVSGGKQMKMRTVACVAVLCAAAAGAVAGPLRTSFQTERHHVRITCPDDHMGNYSEVCLYESWNKPKALGQGKPDFTMKDGFYQIVRSPTCHFWSFNFKKGDTAIDVEIMTYANAEAGKLSPACDEALGHHADGSLMVLIKGKQKAR